MGFKRTTNPGQVAHEKKGEQVPSALCFSWFADAAWSAQQSLTPQQGTNVPAAVIKNNMITTHRFIGTKVKQVTGYI